MKKKSHFLKTLRTIFIVAFAMAFFSCSQEDNLLKENIEYQIATDDLYLDFNAQSLRYLNTIKKSIEKNDNINLQSIENACSIESLNELLDLPDDYLLSNYLEIYDKGQLLIDKYELTQFDEQRIQTTFSNINRINNPNFGKVRLKSISCEDQFIDDFTEIHDDYDNGVIICGIWAVLTSGGAALPCYSTLIVGTVNRLYEAMSDYYECMEN